MITLFFHLSLLSCKPLLDPMSLACISFGEALLVLNTPLLVSREEREEVIRGPLSHMLHRNRLCSFNLCSSYGPCSGPDDYVKEGAKH